MHPDHLNKKETEGYSELCSFSDLKEARGKRFIVEDTEVALFKIDNGVFALSNICPHQHTALIYDGYVENGFVVCPAHGWMFNLATGKTPSGLKGLESYDVKIIDGKVYVKVIKKEYKW